MKRFAFFLAFLLGLAVSVCSFGAISVMSLGDSITIGFNGVDSEGGYRSYLLNDLTAQGIQIQYQGVTDDGDSPYLTSLGQGMFTAQSGYDTGALYGNLSGSVSAINSGNYNYGGYWMTGGHGTGRGALAPNIVLLMSGANDWDGIPETEAGMANILAWFNTNLPNTEVIVGSTPPEYGYGDWYTDNTIAVNSWLHSYIPANYPQDKAVDIVDPFLNSDGSVNQNLIAEYSVHPEQSGYQVIASVFDNAIVSSVPEPGISVLMVGIFALQGRSKGSNSRRNVK